MEFCLWQRDYNLRASDFDKFNHVKPSAVLDLFLDATEQHAEVLGVGYDSMIKHSYYWVLVRIKFQIISHPKRYQKVIVKTWPRVLNRSNYRREYCIEDQDGEILVIGSSEWLVVSNAKRIPRIVMDSDFFNFSNRFYPLIYFESNLDRVQDFKTRRLPYMVPLGFCDLGVKNQINNTKYADYVVDALDPDASEEIELFQIDFRNKVKPGVMAIYHKKKDEFILAKGQNEDGETIFACKLKYKQPTSCQHSQ